MALEQDCQTAKTVKERATYGSALARFREDWEEFSYSDNSESKNRKKKSNLIHIEPNQSKAKPLNTLKKRMEKSKSHEKKKKKALNRKGFKRTSTESLSSSIREFDNQINLEISEGELDLQVHKPVEKKINQFKEKYNGSKT